MADGTPVTDRVAHLRDLVLALLAQRDAGSNPVVVGLDGRSGSGKTTLARELTRGLRQTGVTVTVLHLDNVYPGWEGLNEATRLLGHVLLPPLHRGDAASYASWSWVRNRPGPTITVTPAEVIVVEGVGCGSRVCRPLIDLLIWLEAPTQTRKSRALARDGRTYAPHWDDWAAQEEEYLAAELPQSAADLIQITSTQDLPAP